MLRYTEFGLSHQEVPNESAICIYISGCPNRCRNCHYPELQEWLNGDPLRSQLSNIIDFYYSQATCVCFLGEGDCSQESKNELSGIITGIETVTEQLKTAFKTFEP